MTQAERDKRLREKYREMGIVRVGAWIPKDKKQELQQISKTWREELKRRFKAK